MKFGMFEVEYDLEAGTLTVVDTFMKHMFCIGGDQVDILDLDSNVLDSWELPV